MLNRYDRCFLDLIVSHDSILDLYTRYPLPATLDEVVKLVDYISVIVISDVCDIARLEPAIITDQLSGLLGCVKVLRRYPRAFHPDLSEGFAVPWNLFVGSLSTTFISTPGIRSPVWARISVRAFPRYQRCGEHL